MLTLFRTFANIVEKSYQISCFYKMQQEKSHRKIMECFKQGSSNFFR